MESSAASDSQPIEIAHLSDQQLRELRQTLETGNLSTLETQIAWLVEQSPVPTALALGMRLAVSMACELRDGLAVGSRSGSLVKEWYSEYPQTTEEAIEVARQFLLNPSSLASDISSRLFRTQQEQ